MCMSIVSNRNKPIVGWNLDILDMEYKVVAEDDKVYIAINDETEGWLPLFGANTLGNFVAMPTCWPFDGRSDPVKPDCQNVIKLDIDLLLGKKTLDEIKHLAEQEAIYSVSGVTFQAQLSDKAGNVLQIVPGHGGGVCGGLQPLWASQARLSPATSKGYFALCSCPMICVVFGLVELYRKGKSGQWL